MSVLTAREQREIDQANASGRRPVVFVHGLWMLASSWYPWHRRNSSATEFVEMPNHGHWLAFDSGWHEVADRAPGFLKQHLR
jgi:pimeloyl-ACP methyl ester carboxylesterase